MTPRARTRSPWPALAAGALGAALLVLALAAFSPGYRSGLRSREALTAANDARYLNLALAAFASGAVLLVVRSRTRAYVRLVHLAVGLALAALALISIGGRPAPNWESQWLSAGLLAGLLLSGLYALLKPRRLLPGSELAARSLHLALAAAFVVRFFGEPLLVALMG